MNRENRALREHEANDNELHLFESVDQGEVRYVGQTTYLSHHWEQRPDVNGDMRDAIVFELAVETEPVDRGTPEASEPSTEYDANQNLRNRTLEELRDLALDRPPPSASEEERRENVYLRSKAVKEYVLRRADGVCEGCGEEAPFVKTKGDHTLRLTTFVGFQTVGPVIRGGSLHCARIATNEFITVGVGKNTTPSWLIN